MSLKLLSAFLKLIVSKNNSETQKSSQKWLIKGDRNTNFFCNCAKVKFAKSRIASLEVGTEVVTEAFAIEIQIANYYSQLYFSSASEVSDSYLFQYIPAVINEEDDTRLIGIPFPKVTMMSLFWMRLVLQGLMGSMGIFTIFVGV